MWYEAQFSGWIWGDQGGVFRVEVIQVDANTVVNWDGTAVVPFTVCDSSGI